MGFQPLPIGDTVDEHALDVLLALFRAWHTRQDGAAPKRERARGTALITQLWEASQVRGRGPRRRFPKALVPLVYDEMRKLADCALEEYRDELARGATERERTDRARKAAKTAAIGVILERLAPDSRYDPKSAAARREILEERLDKWRWRDRRVDGLARDLTALRLDIKPGSVRVLKHRARQGMKGD